MESIELVRIPRAQEHHTTPSGGRDTTVLSWQVEHFFRQILRTLLRIPLQTSRFRSRGLQMVRGCHS